MICALDTNVLLDILIPGAADAARSRARLDSAAAAGALVVSEIVYAELAAIFPGQTDLNAFLAATRITPVESGPDAS